MKELHLGIMTNTELAEWFGIAEKTFRNTKEKKLEELRKFADFKIEKGKVEILRIYEPVFIKENNRTYKATVQKIPETWSSTGLDTCSRVGSEIYQSLLEENPELSASENTIIVYTRKGRNELWGKPNIDSGSRGTCKYVWCKKVDGYCEPFTEEEEKIKRELQTKYFGDATEKQIMINAMYETGEIDEKEAFLLLREWTGMASKDYFLAFLNELKNALGGIQIIKGTLISDNAFLLTEEDKDFIF